MLKLQRGLDGNARRQWSSNKEVFRSLYKELLVISIPMRQSGCNQVQHTTLRHLKGLQTGPRAAQEGEEAVLRVAEIGTSYRIWRTGPWKRVLSNSLSGIEVSKRSSIHSIVSHHGLCRMGLDQERHHDLTTSPATHLWNNSMAVSKMPWSLVRACLKSGTGAWYLLWDELWALQVAR